LKITSVKTAFRRYAAVITETIYYAPSVPSAFLIPFSVLMPV